MKVDVWLRVVDTKGCFGGIPGQIISLTAKANLLEVRMRFI